MHCQYGVSATHGTSAAAGNTSFPGGSRARWQLAGALQQCVPPHLSRSCCKERISWMATLPEHSFPCGFLQYTPRRGSCCWHVVQICGFVVDQDFSCSYTTMLSLCNGFGRLLQGLRHFCPLTIAPIRVLCFRRFSHDHFECCVCSSYTLPHQIILLRRRVLAHMGGAHLKVAVERVTHVTRNRSKKNPLQSCTAQRRAARPR